MLNNTQIGGATHKCTIMVSYLSDSQGIYILGDTFLRNFYTTFDLMNNQVQLAVSINAPKGTRVYSEKPGWLIFLYFLSCVIIFSLCCIAFCFTRRGCSRKWNAPQLIDDDTDSIRDTTKKQRLKLIGSDSILLHDGE